MSPESRGFLPGSDRLTVEFDSFQEFVESCSERLSEEGMFLETLEPPEQGEIVPFEVRVREGFRLLRGWGEVVWRRFPGVPEKAPGAAIRFVDLDEPSRLLLIKVVQSFQSEGATLFDPDVVPDSEESVVSSREPLAEFARERALGSLVTTAVSRPAAPAAAGFLAGSAAASPPRPGRWVFAAVALLGLLAGAGAFYYRVPLLSLVGMDSESPRSASVDLQTEVPTVQEEAAAEPGQAASTPDDEIQAAERTEIGALDKADNETGRLPAPEVAATQEAAPVVPEPPAEEPLTAIDSIFWQEKAGETVVVLVADGRFRPEGYASLRIPGSPPRLLVKIPGVRRPFRPSRLAVDSQHVLRVRTGLHAEPEGSTLHVVTDLISDRVQLLRIEPDGTELRFVFADS